MFSVSRKWRSVGPWVPAVGTETDQVPQPRGRALDRSSPLVRSSWTPQLWVPLQGSLASCSPAVRPPEVVCVVAIFLVAVHKAERTRQGHELKGLRVTH
jgi:hypothetical protein